jgi:hypothetical protein
MKGKRRIFVFLVDDSGEAHRVWQVMALGSPPNIWAGAF